MPDFSHLVSQRPLTFVKFSATWCGPCRQIAPEYKKLCDTHQQAAAFLNVDVDTQVNGIPPVRALPTFHFYYQGKLKNSMTGSNPDRLKEFVGSCLSSVESTNETNIR